ncbi:MAG: hypothetical protein RR844_06080 [Clostridium sp.]
MKENKIKIKAIKLGIVPTSVFGAILGGGIGILLGSIINEPGISLILGSAIGLILGSVYGSCNITN